MLSTGRVEMLRDYDWLYNRYINDMRSTREIGEELGVTHRTVLNYLIKYDINIRSSSVAKQIMRLGRDIYLKLNSFEWLHDQYVTKSRSAVQIAEELKVEHQTICKALRKYNITVRSRSDGGQLSKCGPLLYKLLNDRDYLYKEYIIDKKSSIKIANALGVHHNNVIYALHRFGIETRSHFEYVHRGKDHYMWRDSRIDGYCKKFSDEFKEYIREKFDRQCYRCNKYEYENLCKDGKVRKLSVHHIDYNKNSICNGKEWAFVPLCISCHAETNHDRHKWFNTYINYWVNYYIDFNTFNW